ncbi:MAG: hypothetical protein LAO23_03220 [Acidobacteriia bacterium]|nr:hypothetical protein [Terriglobia bacterium]
MQIGGWKTLSVFDRYNIVDQSDLQDAAKRLDEKYARMTSDLAEDRGRKSKSATKTAHFA